MTEDWVKELKDEDKVKSVHVSTDRNLTKGLTVDVRNKLDAIMAQIAEAVASGRLITDEILGSKSQL